MNKIKESLGDASPGARAESIQTMRRTKRAGASRLGSRVDGISINDGDETGTKEMMNGRKRIDRSRS